MQNSEQNLTPANTSAVVNNYDALVTNNGEHWAMFIIQSNVPGGFSINTTLYVDDVSYKDAQGQALSLGYASYLDTTLQYCVKIESSLATYHIQDNETYNSTVMHTIANNEWKYKYDDTDSTTQAATSFDVLAPSGVGYVFCYVRFNKSQELIPPTLNNATTAFTLKAGTE